MPTLPKTNKDLFAQASAQVTAAFNAYRAIKQAKPEPEGSQEAKLQARELTLARNKSAQAMYEFLTLPQRMRAQVRKTYAHLPAALRPDADYLGQQAAGSLLAKITPSVMMGKLDEGAGDVPGYIFTGWANKLRDYRRAEPFPGIENHGHADWESSDKSAHNKKAEQAARKAAAAAEAARIADLNADMPSPAQMRSRQAATLWMGAPQVAEPQAEPGTANAPEAPIHADDAASDMWGDHTEPSAEAALAFAQFVDALGDLLVNGTGLTDDEHRLAMLNVQEQEFARVEDAMEAFNAMRAAKLGADDEPLPPLKKSAFEKLQKSLRDKSKQLFPDRGF